MNRGPKAIKVHTRNRSNDPKKPAWQFYFKFYANDGKRRTCSESGFPTEDAAYRAGEAALKLHRQAQVVENPAVFKMNLEEFITKEWFPYMESNWNEATKINHRKLVKYIIPEFGKTKLRGVKQKDIKVFLDNLYLHTEMAISTVNNIRAIMSQIFLFAKEQGYIEVSPIASYDPPNPNEYAVTCTKNGQLRDVVPDAVLEKIYERYPKGTHGYLLLKICEHTGMRISEAAALAFEDIDFEDRKIYVSRQIKIIGYNETWKPREEKLISEHPVLEGCKYVARNPKHNSKRIVALSQESHDILREVQQQYEQNAMVLGKDYKNYWYTREYDPKFSERTFDRFNHKRGKGGFYAADTFENGIINTSGIGYPLHFVNVREDGTLLRPDYSTDMCAVIHGSGGRPIIYKDFNFHSLRNTFASRRRAEGIPEYVISAMLGHKSETTTEKYMRIDYADFNMTTRVFRGLEPNKTSSSIEVTDNKSFEEYLKGLSKDELKKAMDAVYAQMIASA